MKTDDRSSYEELARRLHRLEEQVARLVQQVRSLELDTGEVRDLAENVAEVRYGPDQPGQ